MCLKKTFSVFSALFVLVSMLRAQDFRGTCCSSWRRNICENLSSLLDVYSDVRDFRMPPASGNWKKAAECFRGKYVLCQYHKTRVWACRILLEYIDSRSQVFVRNETGVPRRVRVLAKWKSRAKGEMVVSSDFGEYG